MTHQLHFLEGLPRILVLDASGTQQFYGSYEELINSNFTELVKVLESFQTSGADSPSKMRAMSIFKKHDSFSEEVLNDQKEAHSPLLRRMSTLILQKDEPLSTLLGAENLIIAEEKILA